MSENTFMPTGNLRVDALALTEAMAASFEATTAPEQGPDPETGEKPVRLRRRRVISPTVAPYRPRYDRESEDERAERLAVQATNACSGRFADARYSDLDNDRRGQLLRTWLDSKAVNLVLAGRLGTGKTHAAYAIRNEAAIRGISTAAVTAPELYAAVLPANHPEQQQRNHSLVNAAHRVELLIIDDLGAESASDFFCAQLHDLVDRRYRARRRTIVTTNAEGSRQDVITALSGRYREPVVDRLLDRSGIITFDGASRRRGVPDW